MKVKEMSNLNAGELQKKADELNQELFSLKFQLHTGHLENTARVNKIRRDIARVNTFLHQKQG
jgi:large subunit ribosomal protein L29